VPTTQVTMDRVFEATDVIVQALNAHCEGKMEAYDILSALSTVAAEVILSIPAGHREELLKAWDKSPAKLRAELQALS
jgi:hypothetical protein